MECVKCINTLLLLMCKSQINMCVYHADNSLLRKIYWTDITRYSHGQEIPTAGCMQPSLGTRRGIIPGVW